MGDLDGDGEQDVAGTPALESLVLITRRAAASRFSPRAPPGTCEPGGSQEDPESFRPESVLRSSSVNEPTSLICLDVDRDGDLDLITTNQEPCPAILPGEDPRECRGGIFLFRQQTPGQFERTPLGLLRPGLIDAPRVLAAADLDGGGLPDLVIGNERNDLLVIEYLEPPRQVRTLLLGKTSRGTARPSSLSIADLDGDGAEDLVVGVDRSRIMLFFSPPSRDRNGAFELVEIRNPPAGAEGDFELCGVSEVRAIDLDRSDARLDLVALNQDASPQYLTTFRQFAPRDFRVEDDRLAERSVHQPVSAASVDLDGDGDDDLVIANAAPGFPRITLLFRETRTDARSHRVSGARWRIGPQLCSECRECGNGQAQTVLARDLDLDGDPDLALGTSPVPGVPGAGPPAGVVILTNLGGGVFRREGRLLNEVGSRILEGLSDLVVADVDDDGHPDLVTANQDGESIAILYSDH